MKIINYLFLIFWYIYFYFLGLFLNYLNFNLFERNLFMLCLSFYTFIYSFIFTLFDDNHPYNIVKKIFSLKLKDIIILYLSVLPFYKLQVFSYIDLDPIYIQLINSNKIVLNLIMTIIINKKKYLLNIKLFILVFINILSCVIPFIFDDQFNLIINKNKIGLTGLIFSIVSIILMSIVNIYNEKLIETINIELKDFNTFIIFIFMVSDLFLSLICTPITILIDKSNNNITNIINITNFNNFSLIIIYSSFISLIYCPLYLLVTRYYLLLNSIDIGIINNITLIILILISCLLKLSIFYYIYIFSIIFILFSSLMIIYISNNLYLNSQTISI